MAVDDSAASLRRIERDLHDGAQARLVSLAMSLGPGQGGARRRRRPRGCALPGSASWSTPRTARRRARSSTCATSPAASTRRRSTTACPMRCALSTARCAIPATLHVDLPDRPSPAVETIVYFCTAELLTNVVKHSGAHHASVDVRRGRAPAVPAGRRRRRRRRSAWPRSGGSGLAGSGRSRRHGRRPARHREPRRRTDAGHDRDPAVMRIVIAEDSVILRDGLVQLLTCAATRSSVRSATPRRWPPSSTRTSPDLVVVDIRMPPTHTNEGLVAAIALRAAAPGPRRPGLLPVRRDPLRRRTAGRRIRWRRLPAQGPGRRCQRVRRRADPDRGRRHGARPRGRDAAAGSEPPYRLGRRPDRAGAPGAAPDGRGPGERRDRRRRCT